MHSARPRMALPLAMPSNTIMNTIMPFEHKLNYQQQVNELCLLLVYRQWGWQPDIDWARFPDVRHLSLEELERQFKK